MKVAAVALAALVLSGCGGWDYKAEPMENLPTTPNRVECFWITAESKGDDSRLPLGEFCKTNPQSSEAQERMHEWEGERSSTGGSPAVDDPGE